jgi:release factor glutamine methyltransferase
MTAIAPRLLLGQLRDVLAPAGIASPRVDAELLLAHLLGVRRSALALVSGVPESVADEARALARERAAGVPLQHLLGTAAFRHLELAVGPGVFIPRPETELILELAAAELAQAHTVVDLCAGSGAIGLSVAKEYPQAQVIAVEASPDALGWLTRNAERQSALGDRPLRVVAGDVAEPALLAELAGGVDVVLSNPPYVPERVRAQLSVEVCHDPDEALFAGPDGLALMPAVLAAAARLLRPGGLVVIEHDDSHGEAVPDLLAAHGLFDRVADHHDLTGRPRFASARRLDR